MKKMLSEWGNHMIDASFKGTFYSFMQVSYQELSTNDNQYQWDYQIQNLKFSNWQIREFPQFFVILNVY